MRAALNLFIRKEEQRASALGYSVPVRTCPRCATLVPQCLYCCPRCQSHYLLGNGAFRPQVGVVAGIAEKAGAEFEKRRLAEIGEEMPTLPEDVNPQAIMRAAFYGVPSVTPARAMWKQLKS